CWERLCAPSVPLLLEFWFLSLWIPTLSHLREIEILTSGLCSRGYRKLPASSPAESRTRARRWSHLILKDHSIKFSGSFRSSSGRCLVARRAGREDISHLERSSGRRRCWAACGQSPRSSSRFGLRS